MAIIEILKIYTKPIYDRKLYHIGCVCHIINLYVQDGMKVVDESIHKLRNIIAFLNFA